jgi:hypothetical protein
MGGTFLTSEATDVAIVGGKDLKIIVLSKNRPAKMCFSSDKKPCESDCVGSRSS